MIALLAILAAGLAVGRWAGRITPASELLLFLVIASIVLAQLLAWKAGVDLDIATLLRGPLAGRH